MKQCEVALALPQDEDSATIVHCIVTGELLDNDYESEFTPTEIKNKATGEEYDTKLIVDVCDLFDYAYDATHAERLSAAIDYAHDKYKYSL